MSNIIIASKASLINVGWNKNSIMAYLKSKDDGAIVELATVVGQATGFAKNEKGKQSSDRPTFEFSGDFIIKNAVTGDAVRSKRLFLYYDAQCIVKDMIAASTVVNIAFKILAKLSDGSPVGYVYMAIPLTETATEDPIQALLKRVEEGETIKQISIDKETGEIVEPVIETVSKKKSK